MEDRKDFSNNRHLPPSLGAMLELPISRKISMVPMMFKPLKLNCILLCFSLVCIVFPVLRSLFTTIPLGVTRLWSLTVSLPNLYFTILICFLLVYIVCHVLRSVFTTIPLGVIRRQCSVIVCLPEYLHYYLVTGIFKENGNTYMNRNSVKFAVAPF